MLLVKEETYTVGEFLNYLDRDKIEIETKKFMTNPKTKKILVTITACLSYTVNVLADTSQAVSKMDLAGQSILTVCKTAFYWIAIISCALEIIKNLMSGNSSNISKIIGKYIVAFGGIYLLPWIFDLIRSIFS